MLSSAKMQIFFFQRERAYQALVYRSLLHTSGSSLKEAFILVSCLRLVISPIKIPNQTLL